MRTSSRMACVCLVLAVLAACGDNDSGGVHRSDKIVFSSRRTGAHKLYEMSPTGASQHVLTSGVWDDIAASVSPDGEQVVFLTKQYGLKNQLAIIDLGTGVVTRVLTDSIEHGRPSWSPDGEWIAFDRGSSIVKIRPSGSDLTPLGAATGNSPVWSPSGDKVVYVSGTALRTVDSSGAHDTLLIALGSAPEYPAWSEAAGLIAFGRAGKVLLVSPSGSGLDSVSIPGHVLSNVAWSADGVWLYGTTNVDVTCCAPNYEIARVRTDGTGWTRITTNGDGSGGPVDDWPTFGSLVDE